MVMTTKKIKVWAAINSKGHVSVGLKRGEVVADLAATSKGFNPEIHRVEVHRLEHELEIPAKKVKAAKKTKASNGAGKPKATKKAKKKVAKKAKRKMGKRNVNAPNAPSVPW